MNCGWPYVRRTGGLPPAGIFSVYVKASYQGMSGLRSLNAIWQHRPAFKLVSRRAGQSFTVRVDSNEKYPWRFPGAFIERGPISDGDYALMEGDKIAAVVERKTLDNLLADFGTMPILHQRLAELAARDNHALVIEASYSDFLNPKKVHNYTTGFCGKAIAEMYALHPSLRIVFCANRKVANEWTRNFFGALWGLREDQE